MGYILPLLPNNSRGVEPFRGQLNERQEKVVARIFKEGTAGFKGG